MSVSSSFRSGNYQQLEKLLAEINCLEVDLYAWIKEGIELTKIKAKWAKPIIRKTGQVISRILRNRLDNEAIVRTLKEIARKLNRVYYRCFQYSKVVADSAKKLYGQVIDMLPKNTTVQLELFGEGDFTRKATEKPMLKAVQTLLNKVEQKVAPKKSKSKVQPGGKQLELNLGL